jgi:hypothetical protein
VYGDSGLETKGTVYNKTMQIFVSLSDIVLVGRTTGVLKQTIINLRKAEKSMGLTINLQKPPSNSRMLKVDDQNLKR